MSLTSSWHVTSCDTIDIIELSCILFLQELSKEFTDVVFYKVDVDDNDVSPAHQWTWAFRLATVDREIFVIKNISSVACNDEN